MSISNRALAIIGGAAALVIVPAGVAFAMVAAHDEFRPGITRLAPERPAPPDAPGEQDGFGMMGGRMYGDADRSGDRDRTQARDGSYCGGDGPVGRAGNDDEWGPGMMGGDGQGMMGGYGPRDR